MKTDLFQSCGHCRFFQICWHIECSTFTASSSRIWNSSTGILSLPLALLIVMLSKAHLTTHSRMSGSRWVITHHCDYLGQEVQFFCHEPCSKVITFHLWTHLSLKMTLSGRDHYSSIQKAERSSNNMPQVSCMDREGCRGLFLTISYSTPFWTGRVTCTASHNLHNRPVQANKPTLQRNPGGKAEGYG